MRADDRINNSRASRSYQKSKSPDRQSIQKERSRQKHNKVQYYMGPDMHLTKHHYFLTKSQSGISFPIAVWNLCMIMGKRPALCLIVCENEAQINKILQFNKLHRKIAILADHDKQSIKNLLRDENAQILIITNKKASILCGLQQAEPCFSLIINVDFHKDADHYRKLHQFILKTGGNIVSFVSERKEVQRIQRHSGLNFAEVSGIANTQDVNKQIVGDIQFVSTPLPQTYSILKMLPYSSQQVSARLFQILRGMMKQFKKSKHMDLVGYTTYQITTDVQFNSYKYVWNFLKDMPQQITQNVKNMIKFKNGKGAVFNIPTHYKDEMDHFIRKLNKHHRDNKFDLSIVYQMPEIQNVESAQYKQIQQKKSFAMKNKKQLQLYIGGLPYKAKQPEIRAFFLKHGVNPLTIRIMKDRDGISKGICFILCEDKDHVARALKLDEIKFDDKYTLRIHIAENKQRRWQN